MFSAKNSVSKNDPSNCTLLSAGSVLQGELSLPSDCRIDGAICGKVQCNQTLLVGQSAVVQGEIRAGKILVYGTVKGLLYATEIEILASGCVDGDIYADSLCIEPGGRFTGESHTLPATSRQAHSAAENSKPLPQKPNTLAIDINS
ncbi:polymer-forming cytoskeletal protein [Rheinheimera muenzenbergensis]|uniref:Polymer-forming cytoskeletal protein n=1 Tax=Rheinheimera muenzenbergensis TaxID=1193628 RepID=A0ABU8C4A6_9GAMM